MLQKRTNCIFKSLGVNREILNLTTQYLLLTLWKWSLFKLLAFEELFIIYNQATDDYIFIKCLSLAISGDYQ